MSVTLRDAQHLCWKNFKKIGTLDLEKNKTWTPVVTVTDLLGEAEETAAFIRDLEDAKPLEKPEVKAQLATKFSDLLYYVFVLSEHYGIELEESFLQTVNDYLLKFVS